MDQEEDQRLPIEDYVMGPIPTLLYIPEFITRSEEAHLLHQIYEVPASRWKSLRNRRLQNWGGVVHEKGLLPQELPPWLLEITKKIQRRVGLFPSSINHVLVNEYLPDQGIMGHQDGPAYFPVVAILSLQSPIVIDFTPHSRLKESGSDMDSNGGEANAKHPVSHTETTEVENGVMLDETSNNTKANCNQPCSLLLMPCSLLVFKDQAYSDYLHGIQDSEVHSLEKVVNSHEVVKLKEFGVDSVGDCICRTSTRVSLTCRLVLNIHRKLFKF